MDNYLITACILHYKKLPQLKRTIHDLFENTASPIKIKILNQGYIDEDIKSYLNQINSQENVEVIFGKRNIGCPPGRTLLIQNIDTPYILVLDDDIYVNRNWDMPALELFNKNQKVGAISFSIFRKDGTFWHTGGINLNLDDKKKTMNLKRPHVDPSASNIKFLKVDDVCAGAMIYRKELKIEWDNRYFIGFGDEDKGMQLYYSPYDAYVSVQSKFIHDKVSMRATHKEYNKDRRNYHTIRNSYFKFIEKWGYKLTFPRHFYYKYVCLLPNSFLRNFSYFWLKISGK